MTTITITLPRATVEQALEALENAEDQLAKPYSTDASKAVVALRAALAQQAEPVQEPMARDDIIRMAREAQQEQLSLDGRSPSTALRGYWLTMEVADLARFAALAADRLARHGIPMPGDPK